MGGGGCGILVSFFLGQHGTISLEHGTKPWSKDFMEPKLYFFRIAWCQFVEQRVFLNRIAVWRKDSLKKPWRFSSHDFENHV